MVIILLSAKVLSIKKEQPLIGIIIINFNNNEDTIECIKSLSDLAYKNYRLYLIDNGSLSPIQFNILPNNCNYIKLENNIGFAGGCNVGIKQAMNDKAKYIWLLNNDTLIKKETLSALVNAAEKNTGYSVFGSLVRYYAEPKKIEFGGGYFNNNNTNISNSC